jgi:hypothetical protein
VNQDQIREAEALQAMVNAVMNGAASAAPTAMGGQAVDGKLMLEAFQFITAAMLEAHPQVTTPAAMRGEAEMQGKRVLAFMKRFREVYEQTGHHAWDGINGPAPASEG